MILSQNLRKGIAFIYQDSPWVVLDYSHLKLARSNAVIRLKIKNLLTGVIKDISLKSSEKFEQAELQNKNLQFLYKNGESLVFMDTKTFEQLNINLDIVLDKALLLKEGQIYQVKFLIILLWRWHFLKQWLLKFLIRSPDLKGIQLLLLSSQLN